MNTPLLVFIRLWADTLIRHPQIDCSPITRSDCSLDSTSTTRDPLGRREMFVTPPTCSESQRLPLSKGTLSRPSPSTNRNRGQALVAVAASSGTLSTVFLLLSSSLSLSADGTSILFSSPPPSAHTGFFFFFFFLFMVDVSIRKAILHPRGPPPTSEPKYGMPICEGLSPAHWHQGYPMGILRPTRNVEGLRSCDLRPTRSGDPISPSSCSGMINEG